MQPGCAVQACGPRLRPQGSFQCSYKPHAAYMDRPIEQQVLGLSALLPCCKAKPGRAHQVFPRPFTALPCPAVLQAVCPRPCWAAACHWHILQPLQVCGAACHSSAICFLVFAHMIDCASCSALLPFLPGFFMHDRLCQLPCSTNLHLTSFVAAFLLLLQLHQLSGQVPAVPPASSVCREHAPAPAGPRAASQVSAKGRASSRPIVKPAHTGLCARVYVGIALLEISVPARLDWRVCVSTHGHLSLLTCVPAPLPQVARGVAGAAAGREGARARVGSGSRKQPACPPLGAQCA